MAEKVKVGGREYTLEDKDAALILAIQELRIEIQKLRGKING